MSLRFTCLPGASKSHPFTLHLTLSGPKAAEVSFDLAQGADPAIAAARKRLLDQGASGS